MKLKISFDDATLPDLEIAEIIKKHGMEKETIFFFPVMPSVFNSTRGRRSLDYGQMEAIGKEFEIGSHTITHQLLTRIPIEEARQEIVESRKLLASRHGQDVKQFCYPRGYANTEIQKIVQEAGYTGARGVSVGRIHPSENIYMEDTTVHVGNDRKEYGGKSWFDYALYMLSEAQNVTNSVFSIWGHGWELEDYPDGLKLFDELLQKVKDVRN